MNRKVTPTTDPFIKFLEKYPVDENTKFTRDALIRAGKRWKSYQRRYSFVTSEGIMEGNLLRCYDSEDWKAMHKARIDLCIAAQDWLLNFYTKPEQEGTTNE